MEQFLKIGENLYNTNTIAEILVDRVTITHRIVIARKEPHSAIVLQYEKPVKRDYDHRMLVAGLRVGANVIDLEYK